MHSHSLVLRLYSPGQLNTRCYKPECKTLKMLVNILIIASFSAASSHFATASKYRTLKPNLSAQLLTSSLVQTEISEASITDGNAIKTDQTTNTLLAHVFRKSRWKYLKPAEHCHDKKLKGNLHHNDWWNFQLKNTHHDAHFTSL